MWDHQPNADEVLDARLNAGWSPRPSMLKAGDKVVSHHQYKHSTKPGIITVPGNPGKDMAVGTLNNILKQAGLKP